MIPTMTKHEARVAFKEQALMRLRMVDPDSVTVHKYHKDGLGPQLHIRIVFSGFAAGEVTCDTAGDGYVKASFLTPNGFGSGDLEMVFRWLREVLDEDRWRQLLPYGLIRVK